jgi:hypothetical protein
MAFTPGLWRHRMKQSTFALCVNDFGVRYFSVPDALHLINAVKSNYNLAIDWSGPLYCNLILNWHYDAEYADVSMPGYIDRALTKFAYPVPLRPQHALHKWIEPAYGSGKPQRPTPKSTAQPLDKDCTAQIQSSVNGTFIYYDRVCDPCILPTLKEIATEQASPTTENIAKDNMLMDYLHTYPHAVIGYYTSDMLLKISSVTAYLILLKAKS